MNWSRYTPQFGGGGSGLTAPELVFIQNLASEAAYSSPNVVLSSEMWIVETTVTGAVNGSNTVYTIPANASRVIVYADGLRVKGGAIDYSFTPGSSTITFASGRQPFSQISVDYLL